MIKRKIYLAAAWGRRFEIKQVALILERMGYEVTSRWLDQENFGASNLQNTADKEMFLQKHALIDVDDVLRADILIRFSDADEMKKPLVDSKLVSGARMFEMGMAYATNLFAHEMLIIVVGGNQNIFDRLPNVRHVVNVNALYDLLAGMKF